MNHFFKYLLLLTSLWLLYSCAQPGYLSGGDKDTEAPQVSVEDTITKRRKEFPPNKTTSFSSPQIEIHFNELITLKDEKKQIVITPTLETPPTFEVKGKKLLVIFDSKPQPNTTYIINFGDAIMDVTEGNVFSNYKYVFSTGSYIDSLQFKAFVNDAITKQPSPDVWVMLYQEHYDSIPLQEKPYYFAKTNAKGSCTIENIAEGTYKSFVLQDENGNYRFDQVKEKIGFSNELLTLSDSITIDTFSLFTNLNTKSKLGDIKIKPNGKLTIPLEQPALDSLKFTNEVLAYFWKDSIHLSPTKDTISSWIKPNEKKVKGVRFKVNGFQSSTFTAEQPSDTVIKFKTNGSRTIKTGEPFFLNFNQPIEKVDPALFELLVNDLPVKVDHIIKGTKVIFDLQLSPDSNYIFNALPNAFSTIYGNSNDSLSVFLNVGEPNDFGTVVLNIEQESAQELIIELLDKDNVVQRKKLGNTLNSQVTFKNLEPKSYNIRIIFDKNKNTVWDTGNYLRNIQPEKIAYYSDPIVVRKGWDLDLTWNIQE